MKLADLKKGDIIKVTLMDVGIGAATVCDAYEDKVVINWIHFTPCYPNQKLVDPMQMVLTTAMEQSSDGCSDIVSLELVERRCDWTNLWILTEEKIRKLLVAYKENKDQLTAVCEFIEENGCTDDGVTDESETFEQGYNNALEYVFNTIGVPIKTF